MRTLVLFSIVSSASWACGSKSTEAPAPASAPAPAPAGSAAPAVPAAPAAAKPAPGPALPAGIKALVPDAPLPKVGDNEMLLLAGTRDGSVTLTYPDGKTIAIPHGLVAPADGGEIDVPAKLSSELQDRCDVTSPDPGRGPAVVTRGEEHGDFPHFEVWFVPTVATRVQLSENASTLELDWSDPQKRWAVVMINEGGQLVDLKTGASKEMGDSVGSPSFAPDGTLYYRSLDGGVWKWTGERGEKIGKGKKGKQASGDLNEGFEPAKFPAAVTFGGDGKPKFK